jgi:hypothetical protein
VSFFWLSGKRAGYRESGLSSSGKGLCEPTVETRQGNALLFHYFATDNLFVFYTTDLDPKLYTIQELKEQLNDPRLNET